MISTGANNTSFASRLPRRASVSDRVVSMMLWLIALAVTIAFAWILVDLVRHGVSNLSWSFITESPSDAGRAGGILPIIVSTLLILLVCLFAAVPLGIGTAILLAEFTRGGGWFATVVGRSLDVLAAVPSIVFGLFGNALFCIALGMGYSILSGGLTLACMVLPIVIRSVEAGLRAVPDEHRLAAAALGMSRTRAIISILLPAAAPGLIVGLVLGIGRALAETAALLFTRGSVDRMPRSLLDSGRTISIHIYDLAMNVPGGEANAYASALVLVAMLLIINGAAAAIARRSLGGGFAA